MPVVIASAALGDDEFLAALDAYSLPLSAFRHGDHLRLAWLHLHRQSFEDALASTRSSIQKYAAYHGVPHIFHETLTTAWVKLLSTHNEDSFTEFIRIHESRLNRDLLHRFWTPSALDSPIAKSAWLPPDKDPLPTVPALVDP
ncbi:MAG TPA: hypothetical protein VHZ55_21805 [Bryobacteraceae bacterium]|jgi:hypothetical protein|nr:hypothetical protein [Bryobacteraceae bacterium]